MIKGIGVDITKIERFKNPTAAFINTILSPLEQKIYLELKDDLKDAYLAKRFAGKEAICKALNIKDFAFCHYSILNYEDGSPYILELKNSKISLSDEKEYAIAFVVIEE